jgi:uncharacterized protein YdhG (YjbR/CyaY superfamily)
VANAHLLPKGEPDPTSLSTRTTLASIPPAASARSRSGFAAQGYKTSKGAIRFPWEREIPYDLIAEITRYRVKEVME